MGPPSPCMENWFPALPSQYAAHHAPVAAHQLPRWRPTSPTSLVPLASLHRGWHSKPCRMLAECFETQHTPSPFFFPLFYPLSSPRTLERGAGGPSLNDRRQGHLVLRISFFKWVSAPTQEPPGLYCPISYVRRWWRPYRTSTCCILDASKKHLGWQST